MVRINPTVVGIKAAVAVWVTAKSKDKKPPAAARAQFLP
jgi:hypothetical protein